MIARVLISFCLLVVLAVSSALAEPQTGRWETNYGPIEMEAKPDGFTGTYAYKNRPAFLAGRHNGDGTFRVTWVQEISEIECLETVQDSPFWGRAIFIFDGDRFIAHWNYCDRRIRKKRDFRWTGEFTGN
ncbi:MAG: hypothetical protein AAGI06_06960 [Pseudomonadota bacterium]